MDRGVKQVGSTALATVFVFLEAATAFGAPAAMKPDLAMKQAFPQVNFDSIVPSEIRGVYEVTAGSNIFYYYPEKDLLIVGEIYGKDFKSLTAAKKGAIIAKAAKSLPLEKAVKVGSGKHVIIEITDPDCPFCRKASDFLRGRSDVTRYIFFAPLAHPQAISKIHYILNATDKARAYEEMMQGKPAKEPAGGYSEAIKNLAQEHLALAKKVGVTGTPTFFINGKQVVGADTQQIEQLLQEDTGK